MTEPLIKPIEPLIKSIKHGKQDIKCALALITGSKPEIFADININDPIEWSKALKMFGWKLAYCNCDNDQMRSNKSLASGTYIVETFLNEHSSISNKLIELECQIYNKNIHRDKYEIHLVQNNNIYDCFHGCVTPIDHSIYGVDYVRRIFRVVLITHPKEI